MIPYEDLKRLNAPFEDQFRTKFESVMANGYYILGKEVDLFEKAFAKYNNVPYCVGVSNGLDAIILSLKALGLPKGSEVIVPANTFIATILAVLQCNLVPVMVEPDIKTYNIDSTKIEAVITPKTRAIIVVHLYGKCCDMDPILQITQKHNLYLLEDSAQAHGATYKGKLAGTFGDFGTFSFYPTKNLGALGDAGGVLCNQEAYYTRLLHLRNYGSDKKYYNEVVGFNNRLDEIQAAFLNVKLPYLDAISAHKNKLADLYLNNLNGNFIPPDKHPDFYDVYHIFNIRHARRDEIKEYLKKEGIGTGIHYPIAPHQQNALKHLFTGQEFPISEEIHNTTLSLPCSYFHIESDIWTIINTLNEFE